MPPAPMMVAPAPVVMPAPMAMPTPRVMPAPPRSAPVTVPHPRAMPHPRALPGPGAVPPPAVAPNVMDHAVMHRGMPDHLARLGHVGRRRHVGGRRRCRRFVHRFVHRFGSSLVGCGGGRRPAASWLLCCGRPGDQRRQEYGSGQFSQHAVHSPAWGVSQTPIFSANLQCCLCPPERRLKAQLSPPFIYLNIQSYWMNRRWPVFMSQRNRWRNAWPRSDC
jgi:hypothetical protein